MPLKLSHQQLEDFYEIGYVVIEEIFSSSEVKVIGEAMDRLAAMAKGLVGTVMVNGSQFVVEEIPLKKGSRKQIKRIVWCGSAEPTLLKFGQDARLLRIAGQILGSRQVEHLINQAHFKNPQDQLFFPFHQDSLHRGFGTSDWRDENGKGSYVQMAMAIDEVTLDNGPLLFVPGSCRKGHLNLPYDEKTQTQSPHFNEKEAVPILMKPGSMAIFGPYTIHGSLPNNSATQRRVFINGFAYPGANFRKYPGESSCMILDVPA